MYEERPSSGGPEEDSNLFFTFLVTETMSWLKGYLTVIWAKSGTLG
jgi:hypothetical protein